MDKTKHAGTHRRANLKMGQNMMLIWLGNDVNDKNEDCHKMVTQLKHLGNTVHAFTDTDQCIDFVTDNYNENVFMIISDVSCQDSVPLIHDIIQLHTIFIFSEKQTKHEQWTKIWPKIKGISTVFLQISQAIKQASQWCEQNAMSISFMATDGDASNKNLDRLDPMFMYSQILKEILLTIQFKEQHIDEFIEYCRDIFDDNERAVKNVDQLKQKYHNQTPIWWYTYEGLLYPMLNHVLRTTDVDIIIKMVFFIGDLHRHIAQLHKEQFGGHLTGKTFTVYRGQGLSSTDFDQLRTTKNGLLSFNNFLSTSKDREVSLAFAESNQCNPDLVGILFIMTIEPSKSTTPFAFINGVSYFDAENKVLFSMHTVFRIGKIQSIGNIHRLVQVDLTLMGEDDKDLLVLTDHIREETVPNSEGWYRLGEMLRKMGRFDKSQQVYEALLDQTTNETDKAAVYHQIAWVKCEQGVYEEALAFYDNANEILKSTLPSNHPDLASSYNNIGMVYQNMSEYSKALSYYEKALEIQQQSLPPNHPDLAQPYNNIGSAYLSMGEYSKSLSFYEKALEIQQQSLPPNHPNLAQSYSNIGSAYLTMDEYSKSLSFYEKAHEIQQQSLPPNHPDLAASYNNIGVLYENMGDYSKARSFFERTLDIAQRSLPPNHPKLQKYRNNLQDVKKKL